MPKLSTERMLRLAEQLKELGEPKRYSFPIKPPELFPGVLPAGVKREKTQLAMDDSAYAYAQMAYTTSDGAMGFPGYPYLALLATRSEFRALASTLSMELTREWITLTSSDTTGATNPKITAIEKELKRLQLQQVIQKVAESDALFGRGQIYIEQGDDDKTRKLPLVLSPKTVAKGSLKRIRAVEPMWTTPNSYNALDPGSPDFYKPHSWFMLGKEVHAQRLLTVVTREVPDMLKPAYNFGGISLSQLAEPYVDNWLRTRRSVSDLVRNFSITALRTSMEQVLQGGDDATEGASDLVNRAKLFTLTRDNQGLMLLDKEREELMQLNTPISGLHELQAQSQEQMCAVSKLPSVILLGVAPTGFGNVAEGELKAHYNNIAAIQEAYFREPIEIVIKLAQLNLFGAIDDSISFTFNPLDQMSPKELSEIRSNNATAASTYCAAGVLDPQEVRERLARDPDSGYQGLDLSLELDTPEDEGGDEPPEEDGNEPEEKPKEGKKNVEK